MSMVKASDGPEVRGFRLSALWPERLLGRRPGLKEANIVCWGLFVAFLIVPSCVVFVLQARRGSESIQRHADFVFFYGVGELANHVSGAQIYNPALQIETFHNLNPMPRGRYGDCPYPPFIPFLFGLFARLPFSAAYFLWMAASLAIFCVGVIATSRAAFRGDTLSTALAVCLAMACYPFAAATLVNGQISAFAILSVGLAIYEESRGRAFYSGLVLALMTYKPTILLLLLPMLVLTRRFRTLEGLFYGVVVLFLVGTALGGPSVWPAYYKLLQYHSRLSGISGQAAIRLPMYLDFGSLTHLIPGGRTVAGLALAVGVSLMVGTVLAVLLWKSSRGERAVQWLAWAATLTWTLLLNIYVPIYDSVLAVIAVILTLGALRELRWRAANEWIVLLAVVTLAVSWKTVSFAELHHVQLLSIMLFVLGIAQLWLLWRAIEREKKPVAAVVA